MESNLCLYETFFVSQIRPVLPVRIADKGDFIVNDQYTYEVGGPHKTAHQLKGVDQAFIAADGIECPVGQKIPLCHFGFLR